MTNDLRLRRRVYRAALLWRRGRLNIEQAQAATHRRIEDDLRDNWPIVSQTWAALLLLKAYDEV